MEQIKEININIKKNLNVNAEDAPAISAKKTSDVKFLKLGTIQRHIFPFIDYCQTANISSFGFDLHQLTSQKILNYNSYERGSEYTWHIDATPKSPIKDIKLTCLLNLSEEKYEGVELILFKGEEVLCKEFSEPGCSGISFFYKYIYIIKSKEYYKHLLKYIYLIYRFLMSSNKSNI